MSESCREHRPLLCDDYSDEELRIRKLNPKFQRFRYSVPSGRAKAQITGAATIITRWPDHLSSLLTYCWIGLGMIAITIFLIYNSILAIAILPPAHIRPSKLQSTENSFDITPHKINSKMNIFMHLFVTNYDELNINNYLRSIEKLSLKYSDFNYNFIVILKDVSSDDINDISDELNNEIALNSLWAGKIKDDKHKLNKNTNIQVVSLSKYMDQSPLKKHWRRLPQQFFGFLSRCIAIWEKGGVAFNPQILTPNAPDSVYLEKLEEILSSLESREHKKSIKEKKIKMPKKKINNIQDIIDNIESQNKDRIVQENLLEAENKNSFSKIENFKNSKIKRNANLSLVGNVKNQTKDLDVSKYKKNMSLLSERMGNYSSTYKKENETQLVHDNTTKRSLLPMFLEYLFHTPKDRTEQTNISNAIGNIELIRNNCSSAVIIKKQHGNTTVSPSLNKKVSNKKITDTDKNPSKIENNYTLRIDLKGNLIATEAPCHAFIGTIFSNAIHHSDDESTTDFIITELSIFCKGVLSSCKAIDVILL